MASDHPSAERDEARKRLDWLNFQRRAWDWAEDAVTDEQLVDYWNALSDNYKESVMPLIRSYGDSCSTIAKSQEEVERNSNYPTLVDGESTYEPGVETEGRSTFHAYVKSRRKLRNHLRAGCNIIQSLWDVLLRFRREGWEDHDMNMITNTHDGWMTDFERDRDEIKELKKDLEDHAKAQRPALERRRDTFSFSPAWVGRWPVGGGAGSFGKADVWVKQNSSSVIVDRVVVKDSTFTNEHTQHVWNDKDEFWAKDGRATTGKAELLPIEIVAMYNLRSRIGSNSIVAIRNYRIDSPNRMHRLYLEYCPHGDLFELLQMQFQDDKSPTPVPEPFIWHAFECLATAGQLLECGELQPDPISAWDLIVHRDYKLGNVFLGMPLQDRFRGYPAPKLGDFGLATMIPRGEKGRNSWATGTTYNSAPEQKDSVNPRPFSSATNVWGVGIVIWSLVELTEGDVRLQWDEGAGEDADHDEPDFEATSMEIYSKTLRDLVLECVRFDPDDRPTFRQILRRIRSCTKTTSQTSVTGVDEMEIDSDLDLARGLRDAPKTDPEFKQDIEWRGDKWELGSRLGSRTKSPPSGLGRMPSPPPDDSSSDDDDEPGGETGAELGPTGFAAPSDSVRAPSTTPDASPAARRGHASDEESDWEPPGKGKEKRKVKPKGAAKGKGKAGAAQPATKKLPGRNAKKGAQAAPADEDKFEDDGENITVAPRAVISTNELPDRTRKRKSDDNDEDDRPSKRPATNQGTAGRKHK